MLDSQKNSNRYDKYRDSGIEWIGEIPDSWNVKRLKVLASIQTGNTPPKENSSENYYAEQGFLWVKPDNLDNFNPIKTTNEYLNNEGIKIARVVPANTPLICCIGSIGKFGVSNKSVAFNQQINAILFKKELVNTRFGLYYLSSQEEQHWFYSNGNVVKILNAQNQGKICCTCPSMSEQEAIAGYLDRKCGAIDETIEKQKSVIEKLKEYKQSIITQAVTKGLDKSAPMKDSGIEWLGQIPQHWEVEKLKTLFSFGKGLSITKDNLTEAGIPVISYGQIHSKSNTGTQISDELIRYVPETYLENNIQSLVNIGDFIFADTSEDIEGAGNCVFVDKQLTLFAGYHSIILKNKEHDYNLGKYLSYLFKTDLWRIQVRANVNGIKVYSITQKVLKQITALVPSKNEQKQIAEFLDKKCSEIDKTIEDKEKLIEKLVEYKKSLIYECVTGKRRVVA